MTIEIKVPPLGESVSEATIAKWHKKEGEGVSQDQLLVELETDKVTLEVNAASSGVLAKIVAKEGEDYEEYDATHQFRTPKTSTGLLLLQT